MKLKSDDEKASYALNIWAKRENRMKKNAPAISYYYKAHVKEKRRRRTNGSNFR